MPSVNQANGRVDNLALLKNWKATTTMENILVSIKNEMVANKGLKQPPEDSTYWPDYHALFCLLFYKSERKIRKVSQNYDSKVRDII